ncbi:hypothetical protein DYB25_009781 [Aphanomyces astaci]|uniref:Uncharacterized protein n=1 Tax=Aphanomyces astaci TaxID=112090 RepID=A0A397AL28_APHAT|nr:hypothetical protein DYB25_009781 [Aphanomyces astaci]RHY43569.1 hypothetical protein DYB34_006321 [Aphanomyces astaci]RHY72224.1 hypothetical protein DYB38_001825 [Aphanomyces astaci]RHZ17995.1 hypothetical protein DYB26_007791 [Aphanomyces astaci]
MSNSSDQTERTRLSGGWVDGKQEWPVAKLECVAKPLSMHRSTASMYEAFYLLRAKHMSGMLLLNDMDHDLSSFGSGAT